MHEITETDAMFSVRQLPWHGLGTVLADYPTREEAQQAAHPWEPQPEPLYRRIAAEAEGDLYSDVARFLELPPAEAQSRLVDLINREKAKAHGEYSTLGDNVLNVRSDNGAELGVVSRNLGEKGTVTNSEMYDIAEAIEGEDKGSVLYETGGSFRGGRHVWLLLRLREPLRIKGDPHGDSISYYAVQNSHDGSGSFRGQCTNVRIVCANTSSAADYDADLRGTEFVFRHTASVHEKIEEAKKALAGWREGIKAWQQMNEVMLALKITQEQTEEFIHRFIPMPPPATITPRVEGNVNEAQATLRGILRGQTLEGVYGTAYALVQAACEYRQWFQAARSAETRFARSWLTRDKIISQATDLAMSLAVGPS